MFFCERPPIACQGDTSARGAGHRTTDAVGERGNAGTPGAWTIAMRTGFFDFFRATSEKVLTFLEFDENYRTMIERTTFSAP